MKVGFFLKEAMRSLKRNAAPSTAAVLTVLITALVLGVFIPIVQATTGTANSIRGKVVVDIYAKDSASFNQLQQLRDALATTPNVKKIQFITKQKALADERKKHPEAYELLGQNPLPNLFRVTPRDPDKIDAIVDRLAPVNPKTGKREPQISAIDEVRNRRDETSKILSATGLVKLLTAGLTEADALEIEPTVGQVTGGAPQVSADASRPLPRFTITVVADAVDHVAIDGRECVTHHDVRRLQRRPLEAWMDALVRAVVVLQIVDSPRRPRQGVLLLVLIAARTSATGRWPWR